MAITRVKVFTDKLPARATDSQIRENLEDAVKKFRRACNDYGILTELKAHEYYEKPSDRKRREKKQRELQIMKDKMKTNKRSKKRR